MRAIVTGTGDLRATRWATRDRGRAVDCVAVRVPGIGRVVVSACLAGVECTHRGEAKTRPWAARLAAEGRAALICPEVAGGLPVPRPEAEIRGGDGADVLDGRARVTTACGEDVTRRYLDGARTAVEMARTSGARTAILKARSPSCGFGLVYDGSFSGTLRAGAGVAAAALARAGIEVACDEEIEDQI